MTVAAQPAQCQDAFKRTVMSTDVIHRAPRHELFPISHTCDEVKHVHKGYESIKAAF